MKSLGEKHVSIASTQLTLKEKFKVTPTLAHGYYVMAEIQTAGRGRSDHSWVSLSGNLHASILLTRFYFSELTWVPLWVSVCVHQALVVLGVEPSLIQLKWPNDLWIDESKKIGGVLCKKLGDAIVAGIGINLIKNPIEVSGSGSLSEVSEPILATDLLESILLQLLKPVTVTEVRAYYEKYALLVSGDIIEWTQDQKPRSGSVLGLGSYGEMLVDVGEEKKALFSEDVRMVRRKLKG